MFKTEVIAAPPLWTWMHFSWYEDVRIIQQVFTLIFCCLIYSNCSNGHLQPQDRCRHVCKLKEWFYQVITIVYARWNFRNATEHFISLFLFFSSTKFHLCTPADTGVMKLRCGDRGSWSINQRSSYIGTFLNGARYWVGVWPFWRSITNWATMLWTRTVFPYSYALIFWIKRIQNPWKQDLCLYILNWEWPVEENHGVSTLNPASLSAVLTSGFCYIVHLQMCFHLSFV
jgi:hypothetical protein